MLFVCLGLLGLYRSQRYLKLNSYFWLRLQLQYVEAVAVLREGIAAADFRAAVEAAAFSRAAAASSDVRFWIMCLGGGLFLFFRGFFPPIFFLFINYRKETP